MNAFRSIPIETCNRYAVLSFDVFDTIFLRGEESERRRFSWIACETSRQLERMGFSRSPAHLLRSRRDVQSAAYRALGAFNAAGDVKLADVHRLQANLLGLPAQAIPIFLGGDVAAERRFLRPNTALLEFLRVLRKAGKRVIAISDTYYSETDLRRLCADILQEVPFDAIYSSSDWGATKKSGELFARVLKAENVAPERVLHWGDDRLADALMAEAKGVSTNWAPRHALVHLRRKLDAAAWLAAHTDPRWRLA